MAELDPEDYHMPLLESDDTFWLDYNKNDYTEEGLLQREMDAQVNKVSPSNEEAEEASHTSSGDSKTFVHA